MSEPHRARLSPQDRRAQLVAVGVNFLIDHTLDELTMDELARRAGVSRPLVFHYFETRQGMHLAVVTTARDSLLVASAPRQDLAPRERIRDTLLRITVFVQEHRGTFYSLVRGTASGDPAVRKIVDESRELNAERLSDSFIELGLADTAVLRIALRSWVAFAEETLVSLAIERDTSADDVVRFLEASLHGMVNAVRDQRL
ncbi:TetR family transcriptional regulator [Sinomonas atrocyanea]|uniref:TetR family transcriptional regulator n=1 Tax=Sinomonas atrocyanea TaxID=37927 RepID=A0A127A437_9MICC|nr:TetR/AcrR family transcriptional regulator [Sinomonas atrocyanea]AMM33405.1 TetR family transcriptional regulator [Sinomonas atrocyanea]GEB62849.1 TetR family transcriptional regulator [Sinomonas atrocyanea]GGG60531.1 TetR family transcriptional regulator [Sinomonas atrocyanea]